MLPLLVEVRLEDVRHDTASRPRLSILCLLVKCGHDDSTRLRFPPGPAGARRACARGSRAGRLRRSARPPPSPGPRAPTAGPHRPSRPRRPRSSTPTSTSSSDAWKRLLALGARFPSWPKLVTEFHKSANQATDGGPTLAQVRSWLGSEVAVGVLNVPTDGKDPQVLGFAEVTRPQRPRGRAQERQGHEGGRHARRLRPVRGQPTARPSWPISDDTALIANSEAVVEAAIDRLAGSSDRLADSSDFKDTLATLADRQHRRRLRARLDAAEAGRRSPRRTGPPSARRHVCPGAVRQQISPKLAGIRSLGFSFGATDNGVRMRGDDAPERRRTEPARARISPTCSTACPPTRGSRPRSVTSARTSSRPPTRRSDSTRGAEAGQQVQAMLGVKLDDSTRCSPASTRSMPGPARRSRRG